MAEQLNQIQAAVRRCSFHEYGRNNLFSYTESRGTPADFAQTLVERMSEVITSCDTSSLLVFSGKRGERGRLTQSAKDDFSSPLADGLLTTLFIPGEIEETITCARQQIREGLETGKITPEIARVQRALLSSTRGKVRAQASRRLMEKAGLETRGMSGFEATVKAGRVLRTINGFGGGKKIDLFHQSAIEAPNPWHDQTGLVQKTALEIVAGMPFSALETYRTRQGETKTRLTSQAREKAGELVYDLIDRTDYNLDQAREALKEAASYTKEVYRPGSQEALAARKMLQSARGKLTWAENQAFLNANDRQIAEIYEELLGKPYPDKISASLLYKLVAEAKRRLALQGEQVDHPEDSLRLVKAAEEKTSALDQESADLAGKEDITKAKRGLRRLAKGRTARRVVQIAASLALAAVGVFGVFHSTGEQAFSGVRQVLDIFSNRQVSAVELSPQEQQRLAQFDHAAVTAKALVEPFDTMEPSSFPTKEVIWEESQISTTQEEETPVMEEDKAPVATKPVIVEKELEDPLIRQPLETREEVKTTQAVATEEAPEVRQGPPPTKLAPLTPEAERVVDNVLKQATATVEIKGVSHHADEDGNPDVFMAQTYWVEPDENGVFPKGEKDKLPLYALKTLYDRNGRQVTRQGDIYIYAENVEHVRLLPSYSDQISLRLSTVNVGQKIKIGGAFYEIIEKREVDPNAPFTDLFSPVGDRNVPVLIISGCGDPLPGHSSNVNVPRIVVTAQLIAA